MRQLQDKVVKHINIIQAVREKEKYKSEKIMAEIKQTTEELQLHKPQRDKEYAE